MALVSLILANSSMEGHFEGTPNPLPSTDDIIDSNPYDPAHQCSTAWAIYTYYWTADDFTPAYDNSVASLTFWDLSTSTMPTSVEAYFWADAPPGPGTELWHETVSGADLIHSNSGVTFAGYVIYITVVNLPNTDYFSVTGGMTYWTTIQRIGGLNLYCILDDEIRGMECYRDIGSGWMPGSAPGGSGADMFRIIEGTVPLDRDTWGSIKTSL
jgi:hypothetical protein